jgi:hypothetical protein
MEILRVPPFQINAVLDVSNPNTLYNYKITDLAESTVSEDSATSGSNAKLTVPLSSRYDNGYLIEIVGEDEHQVDVVRPYVDPSTRGTTTKEISDYAKNEEIARAVIDSIVPEGFYFQKKIIQTTGVGADYMPLWINATKLLKVYENNVLIFDSEFPENYAVHYGITKDKSAITFFESGEINKSEGADLSIPLGASDLLDLKFGYKGFPRTYDYTFVLEVGYRNVPSDIKRAVDLIVDDISCGRAEYINRYVKEYNTDQFKIKFEEARAFEGTGNLIVDKILSKYAKSIRYLGVL